MLVADWGSRVALPIYDRLDIYTKFLSELMLKQSEVKASLAEMIAQCF